VALACCIGVTGAHALTSDADCLMNWAESIAPSVLSPANQPTQVLDSVYSFRAYPDTGVFLGIGNGLVLGIGGVLGEELQTLGTSASFLPTARAANCGASGDSGASAAADPVCLQMVIPAYFYASKSAWTTLIQNTTPSIVIANVSNGPGTVVDKQFATVIQAARAAGHRVKGYVYTGYGTRNSTKVLSEIAAWSNLYGVNDFFLDEVSALNSDLPYYRSLVQTAYATNSEWRFMLNPGAAPDPAYFSILPKEANVEIVVYEANWSNYTATSLPAWLDTYASQSWIMALKATESQMEEAVAIARERKFAGFFATDVSTFTVGLPSYWAHESELASCR
jgi:hypothetical protein